MWWFLAREVLRLRGSISRELQWDVMPDLFFYRDPDEAEKEEQARQETLAQAAAQAQAATQPKQDDDWGDGQVTDWANEPAPGMGGAPVAPAAASVPKYQVNEDWSSNQVQPTDWAAESAGQMQQGAAAQWGGSSNWNQCLSSDLRKPGIPVQSADFEKSLLTSNVIDSGSKLM